MTSAKMIKKSKGKKIETPNIKAVTKKFTRLWKFIRFPNNYSKKNRGNTVAR